MEWINTHYPTHYTNATREQSEEEQNNELLHYHGPLHDLICQGPDVDFVLDYINSNKEGSRGHIAAMNVF